MSINVSVPEELCRNAFEIAKGQSGSLDEIFASAPRNNWLPGTPEASRRPRHPREYSLWHWTKCPTSNPSNTTGSEQAIKASRQFCGRLARRDPVQLSIPQCNCLEKGTHILNRTDSFDKTSRSPLQGTHGVGPLGMRQAASSTVMPRDSKPNSRNEIVCHSPPFIRYPLAAIPATYLNALHDVIVC
jgi:hypothetical protein